MSIRLAAGALCLFAAGCATLPPPGGPGDWPQRRAELQALANWNLNGRVAIAAGSEGFSGGLSWSQRGERAEIELRRPMGGAAMLVRVEGAQYVVTDERGATYGGEDARRLILEKIGADAALPIAEMRYWLVGVPAPGAPSQESIGDDQRLANLEQSGWQVRYDRYRAVGSLVMPERVEITTEGLRLRILVADWRLEP